MFWNIFRAKKELPKRSIEEIKQLSKIVFIDDRKFEVVNMFQKAGWINTKRIKDVDSLDDKDISEAHILFVDIMGVGKSLHFKDEGLGLISALKDKYPHKRIVVYSAESVGDRFHEGLSKADARLSKNADPYEFQVFVEKFAKESFSFDESLERIQKILREEFGTILDVSEIANRITKLYKKNRLNESNIEKIFNLQNAGSLAAIIQVFIRGN